MPHLIARWQKPVLPRIIDGNTQEIATMLDDAATATRSVYDDCPHTRHLGIAPVVHGLAQRAHDDHPLGWVYVQWIACELLGPRVRPFRFMSDRNIVAMDALEHLTDGGFLRRDGAPCKINDAAGANHVYQVTRPAPPVSADSLPAAHRFVLADFQRPNEVGGPKAHDRITVWAMLAPIYSGRARVNDAYKRTAEAILADLERLKLIRRAPDGWYYAAGGS